jgi:ATP-dependent exoDNAse (exonuclease V) alpha subunit
VEKALGNKRVVDRLRAADGVVIDEISMIPGEALAAAESIARRARKKNAPWGGLRIIAVGDFAQLPPISRGRVGGTDWAFESPAWDSAMFQPAVLKSIVRSKDAAFLRALADVREGLVTPEVQALLKARAGTVKPDFDGTLLYARRDAVEVENDRRLAGLKGDEVALRTVYMGPSKYREMIQKNAPVPEVLRLKVGALVMVRANDPDGHYVNGSLGHVVDIDDDLVEVSLKNGRTVQLETVTFDYLNDEGEKVASATNFPLSLAYATTIHKAQGMTIDSLCVDLSNLWEPGQAYVALSRVREPSGLVVTRWTPQSIRADRRVLEFQQGLSALVY